MKKAFKLFGLAVVAMAVAVACGNANNAPAEEEIVAEEATEEVVEEAVEEEIVEEPQEDFTKEAELIEEVQEEEKKNEQDGQSHKHPNVCSCDSQDISKKKSR